MELNLLFPRQSLQGQTIFEEIPLPKTATPLSVGHDFINPKTITLEKNSTTKIYTGVKLQLPPHLWLQLYPRSSYAIRGITVEAGIIDSDFRGEIVAVVRNISNDRFVLRKGERFCQGVFHPAIRAHIKKIEKINPDTTRGEGAFGSTSK